MAQKSNNNSKSHAPVKVTEAEGKEKALKTAMEQIEKNFGKGAVMRLGENIAMNVGSIHTGSLTLDLALGIGGIALPLVADSPLKRLHDAEVHVHRLVIDGIGAGGVC